MIGKIIVLLVTIAAVSAKVQVSIYYESLCQDSKDFFTKQFTPTWRDLKEYITLELVPFGKSNSTDYNNPSQFPSQSNNANFTCHHGDNECTGNKYQACVLDPESHYKLEDQINYIDCLMREAQIPIQYDQTVAKCQGSAAGAISLQTLRSCVEGLKAKDLLLDYEKRTNRIEKPIKSVPTVVFDKNFSRATSDEAVKSFRAALCKRIMDSPKPKACEGSGAPATTAGLITLLTAGLVIRML